MPNLIPRIEFAVQGLFRRQRSCPFCDGRNHVVVARKHGVIRVRHCQDCFLYFTDPIYQSYLGDLYESLYRAEGSTTTLPGPRQLEHLLATNFSGTDKDGSRQIAALRRLKPHGTLLEIGSSWGYFLHQANTAGFATVGVELGRTRREFGVRKLGVDIRDSMTSLGDAQFDLIYCVHTLEHIPDVAPFLRSCHDHLKDGGVFVIEVPHFDLGKHGSGTLAIIGAVHPLGLSPPFFRVALPATGFRVVGIFDNWDSVPFHPVESPGEGSLIVIAEKLAVSRPVISS